METVHARIAQFDAHYSRFRDDSLVSDMARRAGMYELPADAEPMLDLYFELYARTKGAMTPLIGQVLSDAGYDASYSLAQKELHAPPALEEIIEYKYPRLTLKRPALLDFGAAGKGYLVDIVAAMLKEAGAVHYIVDAGGDIAAYSKAGEPAKIALEHPTDASQAIGVASVLNRSICGSAGNRRKWGEFHHIIDPRTLRSPRDILAVWVVAESTMLADALTTCLYLAPVSEIAPHYDFEYLILRPDFSVESSKDFPAELFAQ